jgi:hypothetical protein
MSRIAIDRMEDDIAYLDVDGEIIEFPVSALPEGSKEGDMLQFVQIDASEVIAEAKDRICRLQAMSKTSGTSEIDI